MASGFVLAAPASGSGKTSLTFGLLAAFRAAGIAAQGFKVGPDFIDPHFHALASGLPCLNLDPWAMTPERLRALVGTSEAELCVVEGVMGLFDGAQSGGGSTADLAKALDLPVILVVDAKGMSGSVAALVQGFKNFDPDVRFAGVILNRVGSPRHEAMLRDALSDQDIHVYGALPRLPGMAWPSRHLGLTLPRELPNMDVQARVLAKEIASRFDLAGLRQLADPVAKHTTRQTRFFPANATVAIAQDDAFSFAYPHWLDGSELRFSPLNNERAPEHADFVFLPGGYPELHAKTLSQASAF